MKLSELLGKIWDRKVKVTVALYEGKEPFEKRWDVDYRDSFNQILPDWTYNLEVMCISLNYAGMSILIKEAQDEKENIL